MTENQRIRREMTGNMPSGEYRLAEQRYKVEDRPSAADWEQDAWIEIQNTQQLVDIVQGWARK